MIFHKTLINWYLSEKRELPWRQTKDPYLIWLSEIMLQQTRIEQGLPYFLKFKTAFPTVFDLANAPSEKVMKLWQGLGYYSRARNLHETAKFIAEQQNGEFPSTYTELLKLKGVGDYTASAIASICFGEATAVVDGNVYRVLSRYFDVETPINSTAGKKEFKALATEVMDPSRPDVYNQAIMDFGALQCKPRNPLCHSCPLSESCLAFHLGKTNQLPVKIKKQAVKKRYFNYLVFSSSNNKTILQQRTGKGIWQGLFQFPLIESSEEMNLEKLVKQPLYKELTSKFSAETSLYNKEQVIHKLSHQHLYTKFWIVDHEPEKPEKVDVEELHEYAVPVLIANFLNEFDFEGYKG